MWTSSLLIAIFAALPSVSGGICWAAMATNGLCNEIISTKVTKEECCNRASYTMSWSAEDLNDGALFFWKVLGDGVKCKPCAESCDSMNCDADKKCVMRNGEPKCICAPKCKQHKGARKGPVCGTDGRSYKSLCRLKKKACRIHSSLLTVNYYGHCQSSCNNVKCPAGKYCVQDQNYNAHCVKCSQYCMMRGQSTFRRVCGTDGITYKSMCHLREAACLKGKAIPLAYNGRCKANATCGTISCPANEKCLVHKESGLPRCVLCPQCDDKNAITSMANEESSLRCGSNGQTYSSWCKMVQDSCRSGFVIETLHLGDCQSGTISIPT